mgnify:CR=1 FL=1
MIFAYSAQKKPVRAHGPAFGALLFPESHFFEVDEVVAAVGMGEAERHFFDVRVFRNAVENRFKGVPAAVEVGGFFKRDLDRAVLPFKDKLRVQVHRVVQVHRQFAELLQVEFVVRIRLHIAAEFRVILFRTYAYTLSFERERDVRADFGAAFRLPDRERPACTAQNRCNFLKVLPGFFKSRVSPPRRLVLLPHCKPKSPSGKTTGTFDDEE